MSMGIVDTMMVGRIARDTATAMGAVSISSIFFTTIAMLGGGLMLGLDPLVARQYGAGDREGCRQWLRAGLHLAAAVTPPLMGIFWLCVPLFALFGYQPVLLAEIGR